MDYISIARRFRRISAAALAAELNVTPQQMSNWEKGFRNPSRDAALQLASVLSVDLAWIMGCPQTMPVYNPIERTYVSARIMRSEEIPGYGVLYHAYVDEIGSVVAVILSDGVILTTCDWQGEQPGSADEISDYRWMDHRALDAVMLDNLPRAII